MPVADALRSGSQLLWLMRTRSWSAERIRAYQAAALERIVRHALETVPYYRELGIDSAGLHGAGSVAKLPILTKGLLRQQGARLISDHYDVATLHWSRSSGSTGEPTTTYFDNDAWLLMKHLLKLRRTLSDLRPPYRVLAIDESERAGRGISLPFATVRRIGIEAGVDTQIDVIRRFRPNGIYGTPSWLNELAQTARRAGTPLPPVRIVWTSSEVLTATVRAEIERSFGCAVRDVYGSTEFKEVAVECAHGRRHINFETSFVEVLPGEGNSEEQRIGPLAITNLVNRAMPLIRYRMDDLGRLETGHCPCGGAAPWIADIGGREVDLVEIGGGRRISPYALSTLIATDPGIARFRMIQQSMRMVEIQYVLNPGASADIARLTAALRSVVDGGLEFVFSPVDSLERPAGGKDRILIRSADVG